jgi:type IV pilus assembly protein PilC
MLFKYTALNKDAKIEEDEIEAGSAHEAANMLHQKGLIPTEIKEKTENFAAKFAVNFSSVSLQDKILFIQNLSIMMKAGISLAKALKILATQTKNPKFKDVLQKIYLDIQAGKSVSESLVKFPKIFSNIFVSMFKVGEASGGLDKSLEYLGIQLQREHDIKTKTKGAMIYPAVVVSAIVIVGILMSIFVLPSLIAIFEDSKTELPFMTRMVIAFTNFMTDHTILVIVGLIVLVAGTVSFVKTKFGGRIFDKMLLYTPVIGEIAKKINLARFARTVSSMLKSGTPILESLQIAGDSLDNTMYKDAMHDAVQDVRSGKTLTSSLSKHPRLFSYLITQMIGVGEESGNVDTILDELAAHYEAEVDDTMKNISSVIEPLMILVIGSVVGVLAVALLSPIYSLTQTQ